MFWIVLLLLAVPVFADPPCTDETSVDVTNGTIFHDGTVLNDGVRYPRKYLYTKNVNGTLKTYGCFCKLRNCFRKCCPIGSILYNKVCTVMPDSDLILQYGLNVSFLSTFKMNIALENGSYSVLEGKPCESMYIEDAPWYLQQDGNLYLELAQVIPPWMVRPPDKYCLDTFVFEDPNTGDRTTQLDALICFAEQQDENYNHYVLSSSCMLISCIFILATLAVYGWLPELRNLHGRVLMVYLVCLFGSFLCSATMQILLHQNNISPECCVALTFIIYFCLLSAFFWLNVMSFDIWWTFSGKRGMTLEKLSARARFFAYSIYAFGMPTLLTILVAALEYSGLPLNPFLPLIRHQGCFFVGISKLLYLYGPMVLVILANLIFFVLTAFKINQISRQTSVLKSKDSSTHDQHRNDKQRLFLYVKLFTIMGINWILEVISALYPEYNMIWSVTDAYNVLIGVFVFIIFVCKRKIFRLIKKRYHQLRGDPMSRTQTTVSTRTYSSRDEVQMGSIKSSNEYSKNNNSEVKFK